MEVPFLPPLPLLCIYLVTTVGSTCWPHLCPKGSRAALKALPGKGGGPASLHTRTLRMNQDHSTHFQVSAELRLAQ